MKIKGLFLICAALATAASVQAQVSAGQIDTFSANVQGWLGANPSWVSTGGPAGSGDGFLQLHSTGQNGPQGKMAGYNNLQWSGNFLAGISAIDVDFNNLGATSLEMRLVFFDIGTTTQWVSNSSIVLGAGSGWQHATFSLAAGSFTQFDGSTSFTDTLSNANRMMFRDNPGAPSDGGVPIVATLGIDNVRATPVPEPMSLLVLGGASALLSRRRSRR